MNGKLTLIVNHRDSLYFENASEYKRKDFSSSTYEENGDQEYTVEEIKEDENECLYDYLNSGDFSDKRIAEYFGKEHFKVRPCSFNGNLTNSFDFRESFSLGFYLASSRNLFGLPERADSFKLRTT